LSSPATRAAPAVPLRRLLVWARELDISAAESVSFPELVWAHYLHIQEIHEHGDLHGPAEVEYRDKLERFVKENGRILNAYWCTSEASGVALTEKPGTRVWGILWRRRPNIRLHSATDWVTKRAPDIGHGLHTCETLAIRVTEVLSGTSERIAMQWILSVAGYLLGVVDQGNGRPAQAVATKAVNRARSELAQVEHYYHRAGEKTGRLIYFWGMMLGLVALAALAVVGSEVYALFGAFELQDPDTQLFFVCYTMGAVGAVVSVMQRMAAGGNFSIDYEVGRPALRRVGSFRPILGAIFAIVLYFSLRGGLIQVHAGDGDRTGFFYGALAFAAGFSERRAKIIMGGAERMLGGGGEEEGDSKGAPRPTKARRSEAGAGSTG
jgi:hypothetical protein